MAVTDNNQVFVDSDFWVGYYLEFDAHHQTTLPAMQKFKEQGKQLVLSSLVVGETMTVLSHKDGQSTARGFYRDIQRSGIPVYFVDEALDQTAKKIFIAEDKKGMSYVDCANVAVMRAFGIDQIYAFDTIYHKKFGLKNLAYQMEKVA